MVFAEVLRSVIRIAGSALLLVCFSCTSYRELSFEVVTPSKHTLEGDKKIGFLNRQSYKPASDTSFLFNGVKIQLGPGQMAEVFRNGFYTHYSGTYPMDTLPVTVTEEMKLWDRDTLPEPLSPLDVILICRRHGLDYILSWEAFHYTLTPSKNSVNGNFLIRLYSGGTGEVVSSKKLQESFFNCLYYSSDASSSLFEKQQNIVNCMKGGMWDKGYWYAHEWVPRWQNTARRMYVAPKALGVGDLYYRKDNKDKAYEVWNAAAAGKSKVAVRACLNLALMYELEEDFETALAFLKEAQGIAEKTAYKDIEYLNNYIQAIEKRIENRPAAEQQLY